MNQKGDDRNTATSNDEDRPRPEDARADGTSPGKMNDTASREGHRDGGPWDDAQVYVVATKSHDGGTVPARRAGGDEEASSDAGAVQRRDPHGEEQVEEGAPPRAGEGAEDQGEGRARGTRRSTELHPSALYEQIFTDS